MGELVRVPLKSGGSVLVEVNPEAGFDRASGLGTKALNELQSTLRDSLASLKAVAEDIGETVDAGTSGGPQWTVSFEVSISANAELIIANMGAGAHFNVTVTWPGGRP